MDDSTEAVFCRSGIRGLRRCGNADYEVKTYDFHTKAERAAYLRGVDDMARGCWSQTGVIEQSHIRTADEVRQELIGKKFTYYNSFNGSSSHFVVGNVKKDGNCYIVLNQENNRYRYVDVKVMEILLDEGYYKKPDIVDHCHVFEEWKIYPSSEI